MTLTVEELINRLQDYPDDMPVITEGCDCYGDINSLGVIEDYNGEVLLLKRGIPEEEVERMKRNKEAEKEYMKRSHEIEKKMGHYQ